MGEPMFTVPFANLLAVIAKHKDEKTDDAAEILFMKAVLYQEVLDNPAKCVELARQTRQGFPNTKAARQADALLDSIQKREAAKQKREAANKIRQTLVAGAAFPDFQEQDLAGKPLAVANYKGKVVLLDFWATWWGPCVQELPNVLKTYEKPHDQGFEIIGISLDQDEQKLVHPGSVYLGWHSGCSSQRPGSYQPRALPWAGMNDAVGVSSRPAVRPEQLLLLMSESLAVVSFHSMRRSGLTG